jgi:predicted DNA-binding protein (MmcQ/YjbR family)
MNDDEFNRYCGSLPAASYVNQWGGAHVWKVGGKVFAIGGWSSAEGLAVSFKVSAYNFDVLKDQPRFRPAPYLASRGMKWIQQYGITKDYADELKYYLTESHRIVSLGLTKKLQKELGLNQDDIK